MVAGAGRPMAPWRAALAGSLSGRWWQRHARDPLGPLVVIIEPRAHTLCVCTCQSRPEPSWLWHRPATGGPVLGRASVPSLPSAVLVFWVAGIGRPWWRPWWERRPSRGRGGGSAQRAGLACCAASCSSAGTQTPLRLTPVPGSRIRAPFSVKCRSIYTSPSSSTQFLPSFLHMHNLPRQTSCLCCVAQPTAAPAWQQAAAAVQHSQQLGGGSSSRQPRRQHVLLKLRLRLRAPAPPPATPPCHRNRPGSAGATLQRPPHPASVHPC